MPSPVELPKDRIQQLISTKYLDDVLSDFYCPRDKSDTESKISPNFENLPGETKNLENLFSYGLHNTEIDKFNSLDTIAFVSKMIAINKKDIKLTNEIQKNLLQKQQKQIEARERALERTRQYRENGTVVMENHQPDQKGDCMVSGEDDETIFVAFCRVFTGALKPGMSLYVFDSIHKPGDECTKITIGDDDLVLLQGRDVSVTKFAPIGSICGILGLDSVIGHSATLSTSKFCTSFAPPQSVSSIPILHVVIKPKNLEDWSKFKTGLSKLAQADHCCQVKVQANGEHVLIASGEVHLEKCILDLKQRFAKCEIVHSKPVAPFRETIVPPPKTDTQGEDLSQQKTNFAKLLKMTTSLLKIEDKEAICDPKTGKITMKFSMEKGYLEYSIITKPISSGQYLETREKLLPKILAELNDNLFVSEVIFANKKLKSTFITAFQVAVKHGPICNEQISNVIFQLESLDYYTDDQKENLLLAEALTSVNEQAFYGQLITNVKKTCHRAFQSQPQRLMAACYSVRIHICSSEDQALSWVYSTLLSREAVITGTEMLDSTNTFIEAELRVIESLGLVDDLRRRAAAGLVSVDMKFTHWSVIDMDPYWMPSTQEEIEHHGTVDQSAAKQNIARVYANDVRKRKGLKIFGEKVVEHAEKQRTLTKMK